MHGLRVESKKRSSRTAQSLGSAGSWSGELFAASWERVGSALRRIMRALFSGYNTPEEHRRPQGQKYQSIRGFSHFLELEMPTPILGRSAIVMIQGHLALSLLSRQRTPQGIVRDRAGRKPRWTCVCAHVLSAWMSLAMLSSLIPCFRSSEM